MKYNSLIFIGIWFLFLTSCEEVPVVLQDPFIPESDKIVIVEELSGASCPNCPKGYTAVENILNKFPGRVAAVSIHGDFLAKPTAKSKYDFRNPTAKDLENWFKPWFGKPSASINRVPDENDFLMIALPDLWQAAVERELQKPHTLNISADVIFDKNTRKLDINLAAIPLIDLKGTFNISVYLTESDILDGQTNGPIIIEDYNFKHVLRDMITKFDGDAFSSDMKKNDILRRNFTYTLPTSTDGLWDPTKMEVIISIHHNEAKNKSVVQGFYAKILK